MIGLVVVPVRTRADWAQVLQLRKEVFVEEQGVSETHEVGMADRDSLHVLATRDGTPIGCGRMVLEPEGDLPSPPTEAEIAQQHIDRAIAGQRVPRLQGPDGPKRGRIGRMAVVKGARRQGVGRLILASLEGNAWRAGIERVVLASQASAIPFYEAQGYQTISEPFIEAGIEHRWMEKRRQRAPQHTHG